MGETRTRAALSTMGISVASGAITTMGAGGSLFMCDIAFFQQYGSFIFLVILISLLAAMTNLPAMLPIIGPEGEQCRITPLYMLKEKFVHRAEPVEVSKAEVPQDIEVTEALPMVLG